jgi:integrase
MGKRAVPGEGRPYQRRSDGLWVVVVRDVEGRRKYLYASTSDAVVERRDEYRAGAAMGLNLASTRLTVGQQMNDWLEDRRGKVRSSTWISYESHVRIHLASLARVPLVRLRQAEVRRLVREREAAGCAPKTIAYSLLILRMAIRQAITDGLVPRNVAVGIAGPRVERPELAILTDVETRRLVEHQSDHASGRLWTFLVGSGLRLGEALALRRVDVDLARGLITVAGSVRAVDRRMLEAGEPRLQLGPPKTTTSRRTIAIPTVSLEAVRAEMELERPANVHGVIFTSPTGGLVDKRNALKSWYAFRDLADLPAIRIHDLRHTCASLMLANGATLFDVMTFLGHSNISETAETYGHLVEGRSRELAAGMNRMLAGGAG